MAEISVQRLRVYAELLGVAAIMTSFVAFPSPGRAAASPTASVGQVGAAVPSPATASTLHLDGVILQVNAPFVPHAVFDATGPGARAQVASAARYDPLRNITVAAIPYGTTSTLEVPVTSAAGGASSFQAAVRARFATEGRLLVGAPPAMLFGNVVSGDAAVVEDRTPVASTVRVLVAWVTEAGGRAWVVRAEADSWADAAPPGALLAQMSGVVISSSNPDIPTTVGRTPLPVAPAPSAGLGARVPVNGPTAGPLDTAPTFSQAPWWNGSTCDAAYNPQHSVIGSWGSLIACGANNDLVSPSFAGPPYWNPQLEWECVELSWRYLYLRYQVPDQYGNGVDVVDSTASFLRSHPTVATSLSRQPLYPNAAAHMVPVAGDVVSYSDPSRSTGHTNVVTASWVDANGNGTYTTLNENWNGGASNSGLQTFSIANWVPQYPAGTVKDWLHSAPLTLDGTFVRVPVGWTYRIAGGAALLIFNCAPFGAPCYGATPVADLNSFQAYPADGITLQEADGGGGAIFKVAGGAPLLLSSCLGGCGTPIGVNVFTISTLAPEPETNIRHLNQVPSDGTTLREADGTGVGAIFKIAGGAPIYLNSCTPGCGGLLDVNQSTLTQLGPEPGSVTHHLNLFPSDGTTLQEVDGTVDGSGLMPRYKLAGGAPLALSSCAPGCGSPVPVTHYTIAALAPEPGTRTHHLNLFPADGTTLREADGSAMGAIFKVAGGAPMYLSSCVPGCGTPIGVNQDTIVTLALEPGSTTRHLNLFPADGTALREADVWGWPIMKVAGGAPLVLYSCAPGCDNLVLVNQATIATLGLEPGSTTRHLNLVPADGTTLREADAPGWPIMKVAGGAPLVLFSCAPGCGNLVLVNQFTITQLGPEPGTATHHLNLLPAGGTALREVDGAAPGAIFKIAGGAPMYLSSCVPGCGNPIDVNQFTITQLGPEPGTATHHLNLVAADGVTLREADGTTVGAVFNVVGGAPVYVSACASGCGTAVDVNQYTINQLGPEPGTSTHHLL